MIKKKKEKKKEQQKSKKKDDIESLSTLDLIPVIDFDESLGYGILRNGMIVDCFHIIGRDLENMDEQGKTFDFLSWQKLYSTYDDDLKITSSYFPVNTKEQLEYFYKILKRTENPVYRELIAEEILKCERIHEQFLNREFYIYFYAKNPLDYQEKYIKIKGLNRSARNIVETVPNDKKKKLLFLLANKNLNF